MTSCAAARVDMRLLSESQLRAAQSRLPAVADVIFYVYRQVDDRPCCDLPPDVRPRRDTASGKVI